MSSQERQRNYLKEDENQKNRVGSEFYLNKKIETSEDIKTS